jgi:hypothetical protein
MARKVAFLLFLVGLLVGFFYFRPIWFKHEPPPSILDRMPDGDFMGRVSLLAIARESKPLTYHNKIPFRDLFSPEFLLAQAKSYGLDLQRPAYIFANETAEWGALVHVLDSSKIYSGIVRLRKSIALHDTIISQQRVFRFNDSKTYLTYGKDWMFVYTGKNLLKWMYHVMYSKKGDISSAWKTFDKEKQFKNEKLVIYSNYQKLIKKGFATSMFAHDIDSTTIKIKAYLRTKHPLSVSPKDSGLSFVGTSGKLLNLHFNMHKLRKNTSDPYYKILKSLSRRISFPLNSFLNAWEGDLSYNQGGFVNIKEKVIETELDENFNVSEKVVLKDKQIPAFSLLFSINENIHDLLYQLFVKGILRREDKKLRFLFSPAIKMNLTKDFVYFYSSDFVPATTQSSSNGGIWTYNGSKYLFELDSMNNYETFGSIQVPAKGIYQSIKGLIK